jgi:hypothetical protein
VPASPRLETAVGDQIHWPTQQRLEIVLESEITGEDRRPLELDQDVDVAVIPELVSGTRPEQRKMLCPELSAHLLLVVPQHFQYVGSFHARRPIPAHCRAFSMDEGTDSAVLLGEAG